MDKEWPAMRIVHVKGGIRLINEQNPIVKIYPNATNKKQASFEIPSYIDLFKTIEELKLPIIGVEFYSHLRQSKGIDPPEWRVYSRIPTAIWSIENCTQLWRNIGTGAHKNQNGRLWDVASRISHQLRVCAWHLKELSDSYSNQLNARVSNDDFKDNSKFADGFTSLCYIKIQSFLVDICILRDYLSEFAAYFVFNELVDIKSKNITTLSGLRKLILKKASSEDSLFIEFIRITEEGGWLKILSSYRDLVVHSAPLAIAEKRLFAICEILTLHNGKLPTICCPIPETPAEISASRSKGSHFSDFERQFKLFASTGYDKGPYRDGLDYCHLVMICMSDLANKLASRTPVKPETHKFDESNVIGKIKIIK